jgi:hypothetical protein
MKAFGAPRRVRTLSPYRVSDPDAFRCRRIFTHPKATAIVTPTKTQYKAIVPLHPEV